MKFEKKFIDSNLPNPFTKEELYNYFEKFKNGDKVARKEIINHNIKLVLDIVYKKFIGFPYDKEELVSIGLLGLIKSVDTFDIDKNCEFSTYASKCINNEILMFIREEKKYVTDISLSETIKVGKNSNEKTLEDFLEDNSIDFVSNIENKEIYYKIKKIIYNLPERDRTIILMYFGFINGKTYKQNEIAKYLNISRSNVSMIIKNVLLEIGEKIKTNEFGCDKKMSKKLKTIYEYFKKFSKEQIDDAVTKLKAEDLEILKLKFGEDLISPNFNALNEKQQNKFYFFIVPNMKKYMSFTFLIDNETQNIGENVDNKKIINQEDKKLIEKSDYIKILEMLKTSSFGQMLKTLSVKDAVIISLRLGYIDGKYFSTDSIADFLGIDELEVIETTKKVLLSYKENINKLVDNVIENVNEKNNNLIKK